MMGSPIRGCRTPPWGNLPSATGVMSLPAQLGWDARCPPEGWVLARSRLPWVLPPTFARWGGGEQFGDPLGAHPTPSLPRKEHCGVGKGVPGRGGLCLDESWGHPGQCQSLPWVEGWVQGGGHKHNPRVPPCTKSRSRKEPASARPPCQQKQWFWEGALAPRQPGRSPPRRAGMRCWHPRDGGVALPSSPPVLRVPPLPEHPWCWMLGWGFLGGRG